MGDVLGTGKTFSSASDVCTTAPTSARMSTPTPQPVLKSLHVPCDLLFILNVRIYLRGNCTLYVTSSLPATQLRSTHEDYCLLAKGSRPSLCEQTGFHVYVSPTGLSANCRIMLRLRTCAAFSSIPLRSLSNTLSQPSKALCIFQAVTSPCVDSLAALVT